MPPQLPPYLTFDTQAPERIAPFWCDILDVEVRSTRDDGRYVMLAPSRAIGGMMLAFQRVPEPKQGKNRIHLDVLVDDLDGAESLCGAVLRSAIFAESTAPK